MRAIRQRIAETDAAEAAAKADQSTPRKQRKQSKQRKLKKQNKVTLATHPAFMPLIALWGIALGALCVLVLPAAIIDRVAVVTSLSGLGANAAYVIAGVAALIACAIAVALGLAFRRARIAPHIAHTLITRTGDAVQVIDPASELGSDSLDAPIEDERPAESEPSAPAAEPLYRELELGEFAKLPGRNAVWVEEPAEQVEESLEQAGEPLELVTEAPEAETAREPKLSAIEKLRQVPPQELSLMQMVERFAAALHERQEAERALPPGRHAPNRDTALAEALRALNTLATEGFYSDPALGGSIGEADALHDTTRELRDALAKLQRLRGAA